MAVLALLALLLPGRDRFEGSVVTSSGDRVYVAREGEPLRLRFVDRRRAGTAYRVDASTGATRYGLTGRTGERGTASALRLRPVAPPSRVSVRWIVGGRVVARWVFLVRPRKTGR